MGWLYRVAGLFPRLVIARRNLSRAKARSALAAAAILIGVVAIGTIGAGGAAFKQSQFDRLEDQGVNRVYVSPGFERSTSYFDEEDVEAIDETVGSAGVVATNGGRMALLQRGSRSVGLSVTYTDDPRVLYDVAAGEIPFNWRRTAVISHGFASEAGLGVGDRFRVDPDANASTPGTRTYEVTAVLAETDAFGVSEVFLPISALDDRRYSQITVTTESVEGAEAAAERLRAEYNERKQLLLVFELTSLVRFFKQIVNGINVFLTGLGAISLLVAGVSIANTMLMAVIKRREEIGVRRAVGYTKYDVVGVLLVEAALLGVIGAAAGVVLATGATMVANSVFLGDPFAFSRSEFLYLGGAVAFGVGTSLVAGAYPAWRAANERPVDALRD